MPQQLERPQLPRATQLQELLAIRAIERLFDGDGIQLPRLEFKRDVAMGAVPLDADCMGHRRASLGP